MRIAAAFRDETVIAVQQGSMHHVERRRRVAKPLRRTTIHAEEYTDLSDVRSCSIC